jgi:hypothetical protein
MNTLKSLLLAGAVAGLCGGVSAQNLSISEIQGMTDTSPYVDSTVTFLAFVTEAHGENWYMQDAFGAWNGIRVIGPELLVPVNPPWWSEERLPETGDYLEISGIVVENGGNTEIHDPVLVDFADFWMATPSGTSVTSATLQDEQWEGTRVRMEQVTVVEGPNANWTWTVTDGVNEVICVGVDTSDVLGNEDPDGPSPGDVYKIYGTSLDVDGVYVIHISDIDVISLSVESMSETPRLAVAPNPAANVVRALSWEASWSGLEWFATDATGRLVERGIWQTGASLDVSSWPRGLVTLHTEGLAPERLLLR